MAAVLYIRPGRRGSRLKLILFLLFLFVRSALEDGAPTLPWASAWATMMESIALQYTAGEVGTIALFARASALIPCCLRADAHPGGAHGPPHGAETLSGILGIYAVTVTVHALYNLLISAGGAGRNPGLLLAGHADCCMEAVACHWKRTMRGEERANDGRTGKLRYSCRAALLGPGACGSRKSCWAYAVSRFPSI